MTHGVEVEVTRGTKNLQIEQVYREAKRTCEVYYFEGETLHFGTRV